MRKQTKTMMMSVLCMATVAAAGFGVASTVGNVATAKAEVPELIIAGQTLTVNNNVNVNYYMNTVDGYTASDFRLKVVEKAADGTETTTVLQGKEDNSQGVPYYKFTYTGVAADEMANALYATAYLAEDETVKSETIKYGVLNYAFNVLGLANKTATTDAKVIKLLNAMLAYGAAAEELGSSLETPVDYKTDYVYLSIENATFDDGFSHGLYKVGEEVTVTPDTGFGLSAGASGFIDNGAGGYTYEVPSEKPDLGGTMEEQEMSAADMIAHEKESLTLDFTEAKVGDVKTLPVAADAFDQVTITWSATNATNATIEENVVTFTAVGTATLTATFSCDGAEAQTRDFTLTAYTTEDRTYTFAAYPAGTQYGENETHVLDDVVTMYTTECHFTSELRIYSSSSNDGYAIIESGAVITAIAVNAGNKVDTLNVYGSNDEGTTWTLITGISVTSTSYKEYTAEISGGYKYLKLDVAGSNQVRIQTMTLTLKITEAAPVPVEPTEEEKIEATKAELDALEIPETVTGEWSITLPSVGENYSDVEITWAVTANSELAAYDAETGKLTIKEPTADAELTLELSATLVCGESQGEWEVAQTITIDYQEPAGGGDSGDTPAEPVTVSKSIADLITEYGWTSSTTKQSFKLDDVVSVKVDGGSNSGKAYDGDHIRIYATDTPAGSLTITLADGYELVSVQINTKTGTYAYLCVGEDTTDISNVLTNVSGSSVTLNSVRNGTNGKQVQVTGIQVVYQANS